MRLGLFSPASPPSATALQRGCAWLESQGFELQPGRTVRAGRGLHAADPAERARDLLELLADPAVDAILCVRGGSGTAGILPHLAEPDSFRTWKPVIGLSDVTALHLHLFGRFGWTAVSAPMVVQLSAEMPAYTAERWLDLVRKTIDRLEAEPEPVPLPTGVELRALEPRAGVPPACRGPLLPCNLSVLASLVGTPVLPPLAGAILALEEVNETPHALDRFLTQLDLSGAVAGLAGLVLGHFTDCRPRSEPLTVEDGRERVLSWARGLGVPTLLDFPYGHEETCCALPFGSEGYLTTDPPSLTVALPFPGAAPGTVPNAR